MEKGKKENFFFYHHYISQSKITPFKVGKRQECLLAPLLFDIVLVNAIKKEKEVVKKEMKLSLL